MCHRNFKFGSTGWLDVEGLKVLLSNGETGDLSKFSRLEQLREEILSKLDEMTKSSISAGEFFEEQFYKAMKTPDFEDIDDEFCDLFLGFWQREFNSLFASTSWYDVSSKCYPLLETCEGQQDLTWRQFGYKTVFDHITKTVNLQGKILLNKKVTKINWKTENVVLETSDGSVYHADNVIVTIPLGVLQNCHKNLFNPMLPESKVKAIESIAVGTLGKVFLEFEEQFWHSDNDKFIMYAFLWAKEDLKEIIDTDREW